MFPEFNLWYTYQHNRSTLYNIIPWFADESDIYPIIQDIEWINFKFPCVLPENIRLWNQTVLHGWPHISHISSIKNLL